MCREDRSLRYRPPFKQSFGSVPLPHSIRPNQRITRVTPESGQRRPSSGYPVTRGISACRDEGSYRDNGLVLHVTLSYSNKHQFRFWGSRDTASEESVGQATKGTGKGHEEAANPQDAPIHYR